MSTTTQSTATSTRRGVLLFGGSFDPFHNGHLHIIREAILATDYRRIVVMPAGKSNFKRDSSPAPARDRLAMVRLALGDFRSPDPGAEILVSDHEIFQDGVTCTIDTVEWMVANMDMEGRRPGFLMGDDLLEGLERWRRWDDLKRLVTFVCLTRDNPSSVSVPEGAEIVFHHSKALHASSTEARGGDLGLVPPAVGRYIREHGLYKSSRDS